MLQFYIILKKTNLKTPKAIKTNSFDIKIKCNYMVVVIIMLQKV